MASRQVQTEPEGIDMKAVLQVFLAESEEHLSVMEEALLALESRPKDPELLQALFRGAHTLKGNAASLGFGPLSDLSHAMEDIMQRLRSGVMVVSGEDITLLLEGVDALRQMVAAANEGSEEMTSFQQRVRARLQEAARKVPREDDERTEGHPPGGAGSALSLDPGEQERGRTRTIRVAIDRMDRMMNLAGEIAIAHARLRQLLTGNDGGKRETLFEAHEEAEHLFLELQELIMKVRMVPVGPLFRPYHRIVRDTAKRNGKYAQLVIEGDDVEVDTTVAEHLKDPMTHMIRNAISHGIESPEVRRSCGKDPSGRIVLRSFHDAGNIVIELKDDGAGFNRQKILQRAVEKGLLAHGHTPTDQQIDQFVFEPGFSTAEDVTELSGRGVGMDVVRRNIDAIGGSVSVESQEGRGAIFTVRLPLTLAIIHGFSVGVGRQTYVIPIDAVIECHEMPNEIRSGPNGQGMMTLRELPVPVFRLRDYWKIDGACPNRENVVMVRHLGGLAGIAVDVLYGEHQAVIKPMGKLFHNVAGVAGSTIMGDGSVALILDVPSLLREVCSKNIQMAVGRCDGG